jgi:rRNA biogenesis protein RRP5
MAPAKRKGGVSDAVDAKRARKKARAVTHGLFKDSGDIVTNPPAKNSSKEMLSDLHVSTQKPFGMSVLTDEEPSFPRGGGSLLTPIEKKQIQAQANRDVLFEQQGLEHPVNDYDSLDDEIGANKNTSNLPRVSKKVKKPNKKHASKAIARPEASAVKVESLNYKVSNIAKFLSCARS